MTARKFRVTVNGKSFEIEVEEIGGAVRTEVKRSSSVRTARGPSPAGPLSAPPARRDGAVCAPIPGKILSVEIKPGDAVKKGDKLLMIESMKIENPILAPRDGRIDKVHVTVGGHVRTGDPLMTIT